MPHESQETMWAGVTGGAQAFAKPRVMLIDHVRPLDQLGHPLVREALA
jgi:hypothetical protein